MWLWIGLVSITAGGYGEAHATLYFGMCHYFGDGCEENAELAYDCFVEAYEKDILGATFFLGRCNYFGHGTEVNYIQAADYFQESEEENAYSLFYLGECHRNGHGRKLDFRGGLQFLSKGC